MQTGSAWNAYDLINQKYKAAVEVSNKVLELEKLSAEKERLRSKNMKLKQSVGSLEEHQEILQKHLIEKEKELLSAKKKEGVANLSSPVKETVAGDILSAVKLEELLSSKLDQVEQNLKGSVLKQVETNNKQIEAKLNQVLTQNKTYAESINKIQSSRGTNGTTPSTTQVADLCSIMEEQKNQQLVEEYDQKARSCNIIIHGVVESTSEGNDEANRADGGFFTSLLESIGVAVTVKSVSRIGKPDHAKKRPFKVCLDYEVDKINVMKNLKNLKDSVLYKGTSTTEDYTVAEREMIRKMSEEIKPKNSQELPNSKYV